jgi:hypothetical protein
VGTGGASGSAGTGGSAGRGVTDGGPGVTDGGPDGSVPDGGTDGGGDPALIARGSYLVNAVALCAGCHTDRAKPNDVPAGMRRPDGVAGADLTSDDTGPVRGRTRIRMRFTTGVDDKGHSAIRRCHASSSTT